MNTKPSELVARFIELRGQGWSFARIAAELQVSKPTLINWSRQHQHAIRNLRAIEGEALAEALQVSTRACLEGLGADLQRLQSELATRDLQDVPTPRLIALIARLRAQASRVSRPLHLTQATGEIAAEETGYLDPVVDWEV